MSPASPARSLSKVEVREVPFDPAGVRRFLAVGARVYRNDPHWVAPLWSDATRVLSRANPFFEEATLVLWVARRDGRDVGRIAGILDRRYQARWDRGTAYFGFFESIDDREVAGALFGAVAAWARGQGMGRLLGPMNPSANDECGLLVEGFDSDPMLMMPYNPGYYPGLVEVAGFRSVKDLQAYRIEVAGMPMERLERVVRRFRERQPQLELRAIRKRDLRGELPLIRQVYNQAWDDNWGFVPLSESEIGFTASRLEPLMTEGLVWVALWAGEPAGILVTVLDYNQALKPLRGRLLSPGLWRALPYLVGWRRPTTARVILLGVRREFRRKGIETQLLYEGLKVARGLGIESAEASWILEDNVAVIRTIADQGGKVAKVYRMYARELAG